MKDVIVEDEIFLHIEDEYRSKTGVFEELEQAWKELQSVPSYVEQQAKAFVQEGLISQQLSASLSVQYDGQNGTLLIAGDESQRLLSAAETYALCEFLLQQRDALYEAMRRQVLARLYGTLGRG